MIRVISSAVFARSNDTVVAKATLIEKVDEIGNFSIETANPGGYWGTAVVQYPKEFHTPKLMQTPSFAAVVHVKGPEKIIKYQVLYPTWVRVVQYLNTDQVPSVKARIEIEGLSFFSKLRRRFERFKVKPPKER